MIKWVLLAIGALVLLQFLRSRSSSTGDSFLGSNLGRGTGNTASNVINSLANLTTSVSHFFKSDSGSSGGSDRDALIKPSF